MTRSLQFNDPVFFMEKSSDFSNFGLTTAIIETIPTNTNTKCDLCVSNTRINLELKRMSDYNDLNLSEIQNDNTYLKEEVRYFSKIEKYKIMKSVETQTDNIEVALPKKVNKNKWFHVLCIKRKYTKIFLLLCK